MRSPEATAFLLVENVKMSEGGIVRISEKSVKIISQRYILRHEFIDQVDDYVSEMGWNMLWMMDGFVFIKDIILDSAKKINTHRLSERGLLSYSDEEVINRLSASALVIDDDQEEEK
jgi:hypothetical protein